MLLRHSSFPVQWTWPSIHLNSSSVSHKVTRARDLDAAMPPFYFDPFLITDKQSSAVSKHGPTRALRKLSTRSSTRKAFVDENFQRCLRVDNVFLAENRRRYRLIGLDQEMACLRWSFLGTGREGNSLPVLVRVSLRHEEMMRKHLEPILVERDRPSTKSSARNF